MHVTVGMLDGTKLWLTRFAALALCLLAPSLAHASGFGNIVIDSRAGLILFGGLVGVLSTAACYIFFIWLAIRDRSQIFLIIMLLSILGNLGLSADLGFNILVVENTLTVNYAQQASLLLFYMAASLFTMQYLELSHYSRAAENIVKVAIGILAVIFLLLSVNTGFVALRMSAITQGICSLLLAVGLFAFFKGVPGALTHMLSFSLLMLGTLSDAFNNYGLTQGMVLGINFFYFCAGAAAIVFAIGIARQFSTRQEEKERQLSLSNERFALAALGSNEGLFDWDRENKRVFFSDRLKKLVGRDLEPNEEGLDQWIKLMEPGQQDRIRHMIKNFLRGQALTISFEYRVKKADGTARWLYTSGVALRDPGTGNVRRLVGSTGDITERKLAEVALKDSEARFRSIIEAHPVPVVIIGLEDYSFMYASPSVVELLGVPSDELVGQNCNQYFTDMAPLREMAAELMRAGHAEGLETSMNALDGRSLEVSLSARVIDYQKRMAAVIGINDLTERKEAQAQIEQQRIALEQNEKLAALGSLLAGVAHELNNPLSIVVGQSTLLFEGSSDPKIQTRADKIRKAAERCTRIVRNFLALARRKDPERKSVDINQVVMQALELISPQLRSDNVEAQLALGQTLPTVMADGDQLHQIFTNLMLNAKQALAERPEPRLITVSTKADIGNNIVQLRVSDNGSGVPPDIQRRIFEPFFTTKKEGRGTGIGLSLSLGLAEAHGGKLSYEDTPGGGATFVLTLPIGAEEKTEEPEAQVAAEIVSPRNILLVDDEPDVMQILADLLTSDGHKIEQAENGAVAVEKLRSGNYDLVISDLRMPVMDGPTLYRTIKADLPHYANRIFFVTGDTLSSHVRSFLEENPVLVIDKPYMREDVRQAVVRQLRIAEKKPTIAVSNTPPQTEPAPEPLAEPEPAE